MIRADRMNSRSVPSGYPGYAANALATCLCPKRNLNPQQRDCRCLFGTNPEIFTERYMNRRSSLCCYYTGQKGWHSAGVYLFKKLLHSIPLPVCPLNIKRKSPDIKPEAQRITSSSASPDVRSPCPSAPAGTCQATNAAAKTGVQLIPGLLPSHADHSTRIR